MKTKNYSNDNITTNMIASENPLFKQTYSHSSSYEKKRISDGLDREQNHSRDSSPTGNSNRSPSSTSGYTSSSVHGEGALRDSSSPPSAYVPQHDYLNVNNLSFVFQKYLLSLFRLDHQIRMSSIDVHHLDKMKKHHQL